MGTERLKGLLDMNDNDESIVLLPVNKLEFLKNSPFKIYGGEKKAKLIESLRDRLITPIVVTPSENRGYYKILCGANRVDAYKQLGYQEIKSVILTDITEDEAMLIIIESNLFNRSIDDMLPSELAKSLLLKQQALKRQGERNDLKRVTSGTLYQKLDDENTSGTMYQKLEEEYKLSDRNIRNYIRLTHLNDELLDLIDERTIPVRVGVHLSYLKTEEQNEIIYLVKEYHYKITLKIAEQLKAKSKETSDNINVKNIIDAMLGASKTANIKPFKLSIKDIKQIIPETDLINAKDIIIKALKWYYSSSNTMDNNV